MSERTETETASVPPHRVPAHIEPTTTVRGTRAELVAELRDRANGYRCMAKPEEYARRWDDAADGLEAGACSVKPGKLETFVVDEDA